jgi:phosphoglycolate phosphatase
MANASKAAGSRCRSGRDRAARRCWCRIRAWSLLDALLKRDVAMYVASGTDEPYVREEVALLGLERLLRPAHLRGPATTTKTFSKAKVIERILRENEVDGATRWSASATATWRFRTSRPWAASAVAVASDEAGRSGRPDPWKRDRLIGVGADLVIADYREYRPLVGYLWNEP